MLSKVIYGFKLRKQVLTPSKGVSKASVTAGLIGGRLGNKGGVGISLKLDGTTFLFLNAHLAGQSHIFSVQPKAYIRTSALESEPTKFLTHAPRNAASPTRTNSLRHPKRNCRFPAHDAYAKDGRVVANSNISHWQTYESILPRRYDGIVRAHDCQFHLFGELSDSRELLLASPNHRAGIPTVIELKR